MLVVSADIYRPAAIKQLETLATDVGVGFHPSSIEQKPIDIVNGAIDAAKKQFYDVLLVDTAGRLHVDADMMDEIKALHAAVKPVETLFVVDAMTGQDAANTAKAFNDALPLTGVILTKADGDARGGAALSVRQITGKPIKFIGMGEKVEDRAGMLVALATLDPQPESVPINALVAVEGTPMEDIEPISIWEMVRMVATTRIVMPQTQVRLSAGRTQMSREGQAMCFFAGANSIFAGDKLLTTPNPDVNEDMEMFKLLGLNPQAPFVKKAQPETVEAAESKHLPKGEKPKWSRPGHTIPRNEEAKAKAKA